MDRIAPLIYVVEDNDEIRTLLVELLNDTGYQALGIATAQDARQLLSSGRPALVLLDNHLEQYAAGWDLLTQLRADAATTALPIILMSVDVGFLREHCVELHAQRCLALEKPFDLDDLLTTVYAAIGVAPIEQRVPAV
jgi:CheY-like chemotaxis protein